MRAAGTERPHTERWAYRWLYAAHVFELCARIYPWTGRRVFHGVSRAVAALYARTQPGVVRVVQENLSLLGGSPDARAARQVFRQFATVIADYTAAAAMPEHEVLGMCAVFEGREHLDAVAEGGLLATGHFGFFEFGAAVLGSLALPLTVATLPEPRPTLSAWRARWRKRWGAETIEIGTDPFASLAVRHTLDSGRLVALLADRPHPSQALPVPMPGGRGVFSTTPALLAATTGRPILPVVIFLRPEGLYHVRALPPLYPNADSKDKRSEIQRLTLELARALTPQFARHPTQWFQFAPLPRLS